MKYSLCYPIHSKLCLLILTVCLLSQCTQTNITNDDDYVSSELAKFNINSSVKSNWHFNNQKIFIANYTNDSLSIVGMSPVLFVKQNEFRDVFIPLFNQDQTTQKPNLQVLSHLNNFIQRIPYFKDNQITNAEKIALIKKLYLWTIAQQPFLNKAHSAGLPMMYFLNLRNIFEIKNLLEVDKIATILIKNHENYMPISPFKLDLDSSHLKNNTYQKDFEKVMIDHKNAIGSQQRTMFYQLLHKRNIIAKEMKNPHNFFYLSIPNMALHMVKIYNNKNQWTVIGMEVNWDADNGIFFTPTK